MPCRSSSVCIQSWACSSHSRLVHVNEDERSAMVTPGSQDRDSACTELHAHSGHYTIAGTHSGTFLPAGPKRYALCARALLDIKGHSDECLIVDACIGKMWDEGQVET